MDTSKLPTSRAQAKAEGAAYYFTGKPCTRGHVAPRKTKGVCLECVREDHRVVAEQRASYFAAYNKSEAGRATKQRYYAKNRDAVIARAQTRPDADKRAYRDAWKRANKVQVRADTKNRRRKHRLATPTWLTREQKSEMRALYQTAITLTQTTGEAYVVDHIYPLRSEVVCGLHVPWNLRVMTRHENLRKANRLPDDSEARAFVAN